MGSDYGESSVISGGSSSRFDFDKVKNSDGENDPLDDQARVVTGIFGVLFTVSKEKALSWKFVAFRLFLDWLQLWLLLVSPMYGFTGWIDNDNVGWQIVSFINLNQFMSARGYTFFLACLYIMTAGLVVNIGLCVWVAWSFQNNRFDHVWPIAFLRYFSLVFYQVLDIASLTLFLITLDCGYYNVDASLHFENQEFPDKNCFAMPHLAHVIVSVIALIIFVVLAGFFSMAEIELDLSSKNLLGMAHTKVEVYGFAIKFVMTAASVFLNNFKHYAVLQLVLSALLLYLYLRHVPHLSDTINIVRVGTCTSVLYTAIILVFLQFKPNVDANKPDKVYEFSNSMTIAMWAGIVPTFGVGALLAWLRLRRFKVTVLNRFRDASLDTPPKHIYKFSDSREVEIVARCCRKWAQDDLLDAEAMALAETVMKAGMALMPSDCYMIILYSSFLIDVQTSYQSGYTLLQVAKKASPSFLERFAIFSREQQHTQKSAGAEPGSSTDLVSYVEFQRNYRLALRVHKESLIAMRTFWQCLLRASVKFEDLSKAMEHIDVSVKQAERVYRNVLQRHANHVKLLRMYGKFMEFVKNDPWAAAKWYTEADKLEQAEEDARKSNVFGDVDTSDPTVQSALATLGPASDDRAVVVMNAQSLIQVTNRAAHEIFGYFGKNELVGKNVNIMIPPPFADRHGLVVREYLATGKENTIGKTFHFIALHRDRYVFPVSIRTTKVSGIGEDTMFMGMIEALPSDPSAAMAWVQPTNDLISADKNFLDWFGYKPDDLPGAQLEKFVVEWARVESSVRQARSAIERPGASDSRQRLAALDPHHQVQQWALPGVHIRHKYAEPVEVDMVLGLAGVGSFQMFSLAVRRKQPASHYHMLVADPKGSLLHVTQDLAGMLGTTPKALYNSAHMLESLMFQPFATMHRTLAASVPMAAAPPHSCRSGLSVLLQTATVGQEPEVRPFRLQVARRTVMDEAFHVVHLRAATMEQALAERRLVVYCDHEGNITDAELPPGYEDGGFSAEHRAGPFGFEPQSVVGHNIGSLVDVLGGDEATPTGILLAHLAAVSADAPGASWRAGVEVPYDKTVLQLSALAGAMLTQHTRPAVMQVSLQVQEPSKSNPPRPPSAVSTYSQPAAPPMAGQLQQPGTRDSAGSTTMPGGKSSQGPGPIAEGLEEVEEGGSSRVRAAAIMPSDGGATEDSAQEELRPHVLPPPPPLPAPVPAATAPASPVASQSPRALMQQHFQPPQQLPLAAASSPARATWPVLDEERPHINHPAPPSFTAKAPIVEPAPSTLVSTSRVVRISSGASPRAANAAQPTGAKTFKSFRQSRFSASELHMDSMRFKVTLWPAELCTSLIDLDAHGNVVGSSVEGLPENTMFPRGLLLGASSSTMVGSHISQFLPLGGRPVADLLDPATATLGGAAMILVPRPGEAGYVAPGSTTKARRRSVLKSDKPAPSPTHKVGPVVLLETKHWGDGESVGVSVQAVPRTHGRHNHGAGACSSAVLQLVVRVWDPNPGGRADFASWLMAGGCKALIDELRAPMQRMRRRSMLAKAAEALHAQGAAGLEPRHPLPMHAVAQQLPQRRHASLDAGMPKRLSPAFLRPAGTVSSIPQAHLGGRPSASSLPASEPAGNANQVEPADEQHGSLDMLERELLSPKAHSVTSAPGAAKPAALALERNASAKKLRFGSGNEAYMEPTEVKMDPVAKEAQIMQWAMSDARAATTAKPQLQGEEDESVGAAAEAADEDYDCNISSRAGSDEGSEEGGPSGAGAAANDSSADDIDEAGTMTAEATDYRRGQRFKKLSRMLAGAEIRRLVEGFKVRNFVVIGILLAVHVAVFAMLYVLTKQQMQIVTDLDNTGLASRKIGEIIVNTQSVFILFSGRGVPWLYGLSGPSDIDRTRKILNSQITQFKALHAAFFVGTPDKLRTVPDKFGLKELWQEASVPEVYYFQGGFNESITGQVVMGNATVKLGSNNTVTSTNGTYIGTLAMTPVNQNASLWNLGNAIARAADIVYANCYLWNSTGRSFNNWAEYKYIMDNANYGLSDGYFQTLDAMVQLSVQGTTRVTSLQIAALIVEGVVFVAAGALYLWYLCERVMGQRYDMYFVFMLLPVGMLRGLATRKLDLGDEDDDDDDVPAGGEMAAAPAGKQAEGLGGGQGNASAGADASFNGPQPGPNGMTMTRAASIGKAAPPLLQKINVPGARPGDGSGANAPPTPAGLVAKLCSVVCPGLARRNRAVRGGRRRLVRSLKPSMAVTWPFIAYGLLIIILDIIAYQELNKITGPIAMFNMVTFVAGGAKRHFCWIQEICQRTNVVTKNTLRGEVASHMTSLVKDYKVLLYGASALPDETSKHYTLATQGLAESDGPGPWLLYHTTDCLADLTQAGPLCKPVNSPYYADTMNGVARMVDTLISVEKTIIQMNGSDPDLKGPEFAWLWSTRSDITGGLKQLNNAYKLYVDDVYSKVLNLQVVAFALPVVVLLAYLLFVLRPFLKQANNEIRRIAELLSQLPADVDVEALLGSVLYGNRAVATAAKTDVEGGGAGGTAPIAENTGKARRASLNLTRGFGSTVVPNASADLPTDSYVR